MPNNFKMASALHNFSSRVYATYIIAKRLVLQDNCVQRTWLRLLLQFDVPEESLPVGEEMVQDSMANPHGGAEHDG